MKRKMMLILSCLLLSIGFVVAQTSKSSGVVVDNTGEPVIGASVVVKGTTIGVSTDIDGKFSINIPEGRNTLVFTLVGMKSAEMRASQNMRVVMMNDDKLLEEVVVTAMGITREKKALGYNTQTVKIDNLVQASNSDLAGSLQGKVSGVKITPSSGMPGSSSQFVIRGARSFKGNNTPLYVVDGMPISSTSDINTDTQNNGSVSGTDYANRAVDIDPNDIASIEILKGQAASALYGIRASNGVILISTKSGKGAAKGKPYITFNSGISFDKMARYPKMQTKYAQGTGGLFDPTQSKSWGPTISELPNSKVLIDRTKPELGVVGGNHNGHNGKYYVQQRANAGLDPWVEPGIYNNVKDFFNTGVTWNNSVNLVQALDKGSYSISLSSATQDGIVPSTGMDRYTAKIGAETSLSKHWSTGFVGNYVNTSISKVSGANDGLVATVFGAPPSYDLAGIPSHFEGNPYKSNGYRGGSFVNPYWFTDNNDFTEKTSRFYGNAYVDFKTNLNSDDKKLILKYQFGTDAYTTNYLDSWGYGMKGSSGQNNGQMTAYSWSMTNFNSLVTANFNWTINKDMSLSAILGNEVIHETKNYALERGIGYSMDGWNNISNATSFAATKEYYSRRTVGFFGSASFSYKNMAYLGVTGREDIVSYMPPNARSFFYPSISASFILTELNGVKNSFLDFAKIRAAYAEVGQAAEDYRTSFFYTPVYGGGFYMFTPLVYPIENKNAFVPYTKIWDPKLKPQNTRSYELGFDATFLNGLFDLSYTFSKQSVKDQIFDVPLAPSTGVEVMVTNAGRVHTNAHEITLNINPIRTKDIDWSIGLNWSKIDNYVDELAEGVNSISLGGFVTPQVRAGVGEKFPVIFGSDYARDDQGRILVNDQGIPMVGKDTVIGRVSPDFTLGMNTTLIIKKIRIAAVFDWKSGGQMYHGTNNLLDVYGVSKTSGDARDNGVLFDGWKADGTKNDILVTGGNVEKYYASVNNIDASSVYDNSFIKLRELSVGYNVFKNSWVDVTLNAFARNILIWTELPNFDPEGTQGNNNMGGAFERFSLPQTSSYGFGVNLKF